MRFRGISSSRASRLLRWATTVLAVAGLVFGTATTATAATGALVPVTAQLAAADDPAADDATDEVTTTEDGTADDGTADDATTDDTTGDDATADDATADDTTVDDATADDPTADDATADDATVDDATELDAADATQVPQGTLAGFSASSIISDAVFTDRSTMTEAQIQTFFDSKVERCRGGSDSYGAIVCLKDYRTDSVDRPADKYCDGYRGAKGESAARIISRVSQACGINPQVLIVMLQKEQGLVTHTWPSAWRYDAALGQGCPDDAACNPAYVGFFHQIYGAARQMQTYMEGRYFTWYAPGKTWNILYHPNRGCGAAPVGVRNAATSALYYYTPYQPNAAAMRAGYGTGDSCSSYGNRNFYNYFTDWFGSTQDVQDKPTATGPLAEIDALYSALGRDTSVLGKADAAPKCASTTARCTWKYENGIITWTKALGALPVYGDVFTEYTRSGGLGGTLGYPAVTPKAVTDRNGNGIAQEFDKGWIHSSAQGTYTSNATIMKAYSAQQWVRGDLGWPAGGLQCTAKSCTQDFERGLIGYFSGKPAFAVAKTTSASIDLLHKAEGGNTGKLGKRGAARQLVVDKNGDGLAQKYAKGWIHSSAKGTFSSSTTIMTAYSSAGWLRGYMGWPTSKESCSGTYCSQEFTGGTIAYTKGKAAVVLRAVKANAIAAAHKALGGNGSWIGAAKAQVQVVSDAHGNGLAQKYAKGWIHASKSGTFASPTIIMTAYSSAGWLRGKLAWPTGNQNCTSTYCYQPFTGGTIAYIKGKAAVPMVGVRHDAVSKMHSSLGGVTGKMGPAVKDLEVVADRNGNGFARKFNTGWIHASDRGTYTSSNTVMTAYSKAGWLRGKLGWPTSAEKCSSTLCTQSFEGGTISYKPGGVASFKLR